jgi:hypothetical protein
VRRNSKLVLLSCSFYFPTSKQVHITPHHSSPSSPALLFFFFSLQHFLLPFLPQNPKWWMSKGLYYLLHNLSLSFLKFKHCFLILALGVCISRSVFIIPFLPFL